MTRTQAVWLAALTILTVSTLRAQGPVNPFAEGPPIPTGTGLIVGQVLDATSNRPVANAIIALSIGPAVGREMVEVGLGRPNAPKRLISDGQGRFVFHDLGAGIYTFNATSIGYVDGAYGQRRPSGPAQPFVLAEDQRVGNVTIRLWQEAALGGTVTEEAGEPVIGQTVYLLRRNQANGRTQLATTASARTDDRGMYRFAKLLPGDYLVVVPSTLNNVPVSEVAAYYNAMNAARGGNITTSPIYQSINTSRGVMPTSPGIQVGDAILQIAPFASSSLPPTVGADGRVRAYPTTFYPSAPSSARAVVITVAAGEERAGLDIQVQPAPLVAISGTLTGPGGPEAHFGVRLTSADFVTTGAINQFDAAATETDANGAFSFVGVVPGQYVIRAAKVPRPTTSTLTSVTFNTGGGGVTMISMSGAGPAGRGVPPPLPTDPSLWAEMPISVGDDPISGLNLQLRAAPTIGGRMVFEGGTAQPTGDKVQAMSVSLALANGQLAPYCCPASRVGPDGQFNTQGYVPDKYYVNANNVPTGWYLKAATARGRDLIRAPLTLAGEPVSDVVFTFSDAAAEVSGVVNDQTGKATPTASVVLFPSDFQVNAADGLNPRLIRLSRPSPQTGTYRFLNVVPGEYLIVAADDLALAKWPDTALMSDFSVVAARLTVAAGDKKTQDLTTRRGQ